MWILAARTMRNVPAEMAGMAMVVFMDASLFFGCRCSQSYRARRLLAEYKKETKYNQIGYIVELY
jgi:hypothetical protein